jgi:hypothetical protein
MRAVLLIPIVGLCWHRFASSSFKGFLVPSLISSLLGDVMAAVWGQKDVNWDGFPSSNLIPLNIPRRNVVEPIFSFSYFPKIFLPNMEDENTCPRKKWG